MSLLAKTDLVAKFNRVQNGVDDYTNQKETNWINKLEICVIHFMDKIFHRSLLTYKDVKDYKIVHNLESKENTTPGRHVYYLLQEISEVMSHLVLDMMTLTQPMFANLLFMNNQDFILVETEEILKIVEKFETNLLSIGYGDLKLNERLNKLIDFVDNLRKFSEYLLQASRSRVFGKSPLKILRDLREGRSMKKW